MISITEGVAATGSRRVMNHILPMVFAFIVSGMVAAAFISIMVCGALDGLSRLLSLRSRRGSRAQPSGTAEVSQPL
jgi:hypothetical protein